MNNVPPSRAATLSRALLPGQALDDWSHDGPVVIDGLLRLAPADQQEEAAAIALVLREALETKGARAALVTPDRDLAGRVATELARYGVIADDSAGERLAATPPAVFLRLLAVALAEQLAPVPLLAVLKHPLAGAGMPLPACRAAARALEVAALRGPRPGPGLSGLRQRVDRARDEQARPGRGADHDAADTAAHGADLRAAVALLARLEACLEPALRSGAALEAAPAEMLAGLIESAERLAATDEHARPLPPVGRRGRRGAGHRARRRAGRAAGAARPAAAASCPGLLDAVLEGAVVRTRRALRGRAGAEHPARVHLGPAGGAAAIGRRDRAGRPGRGRLAAADRTRPVAVAPDARRVGLPSPEEAVGPGGARLRRRLPAPRRPWCCPARAGATAPPRCRRAG